MHTTKQNRFIRYILGEISIEDYLAALTADTPEVPMPIGRDGRTMQLDNNDN